MEKCKGKWTEIEVPSDLYELIKEGARLKGCTLEEFVTEAIKRVLEELEEKKKGAEFEKPKNSILFLFGG